MGNFKIVLLCVLAAGIVPASAQISSFPFTENFDEVTAPAIPSQWVVNGFVTYASSPRSLPNCISATGNKSLKMLTSPVFDFTGAFPDKLIFWERRSGTAAAYRLQLCVSTDGINFQTVLAEYDTINSTTSYVQRTINLANAGLQNQSTVQFQWQVLVDSTNNTGVLRIDDITLTIAAAYDLSLSHFVITPSTPRRNDSLKLSVTAKNLAVTMAENYSVHFYLDINQNGIAESNEQFVSAAENNLASNDSNVITVTYAPLSSGTYRFIAVASLLQDENHTNDTAVAVVTIGNIKGDVLVNEIMYAPTGDEPEWVELYNASPDTVNLKGWRISDSNVSTKSIIASTDYFLPPKHYVVIAKSTDFSSVHPNIPVIVASFAALNNTTNDDVVIYDPAGTTIDSVQYSPSWGGQNGISLERIDWQVSSTSARNWGSSHNIHGSTPDSINSIARLDVDAMLVRLTQTSLWETGRYIPVVSATIDNIGRINIDTILLTFYNGDEPLWDSTIVHHLVPDDSLLISKSFPQFPHSCTILKAKIHCVGDERSANDTASIVINMQYTFHSIVVNEIMYAPAGDEPEWIELYNMSSDTVNLKGWKISDSNISTKSIITSADCFLPPTNYAVIAKSTDFISVHPNIPFLVASFAALNNTTTDAVVLFDPVGTTIDSVQYLPSWGGQNGKSLERIDVLAASTLATNWGSSQDSNGSTPGKINSIARLDCDAALIRITQTTEVENGKVVPEIITTIRNVGKREVDTLQLCFSIDSTRRIGMADSLTQLCSETIIQHLAPMDSMSISKSLPMLSSGTTKIFLKLFCRGDERDKNDTASMTISVGYESHALVINEIMYDPLEGQNEWIEFYNAGNIPLDLDRWSFCDRPTMSGSVNQYSICDSLYNLLPQRFVIVAADSTILTIFPDLKNIPNGNILFIRNRSSGFGFNDDGDAIQLKDQTSKTIDSVAYSPTWHNPAIVDTKGRSLERINPLLGSNDPRNWSTCTNLLGGTPGKANSIFTASAPTGIATISLSPNPFSPDGDGFEDFCMISFQLPMSSAFVNVRLYDIKGRLIRTLANTEFSGSNGSFVWNGLDDKGQRVRIGVYIVLFEANDPTSHQSITVKKVVVVALKL